MLFIVGVSAAVQMFQQQHVLDRDMSGICCKSFSVKQIWSRGRKCDRAITVRTWRGDVSPLLLDKQSRKPPAC